MNTHSGIFRLALLAAILVGSGGLIAACATHAAVDPGAARLRADLNNLESDGNLGGRAQSAMRDAEAAVRWAELPESRRAVSVQLLALAEHKVQYARAQAMTSYNDEQRKLPGV